MKSKFANFGRDVRFMDNPPRITDDLEPGFFTIEVTPMTGELYLSRIDKFPLPSKLYGDIEQRAERAIRTFRDRSGTTGLLLNGEKGSGKTLLGKLVANRLFEEDGMSVIVLNKPIAGDELGKFIQKIGAPVTLFLDEFEKVYGKTEAQHAMLTVLDGVYASKMMAVITANQISGLVDPLINRPGRMYYRMDYHGLTTDFVRGYAQDNLNDQSEVENLVRLSTLTSLNFDQLITLVAEMNRFKESAIDAVQFLNIAIDTGEVDFDVKGFVLDGKDIPQSDVLTYRLSLDTDADPDESVYIDVMLPNTEGETIGDLLAKSEVRNATSTNSYRDKVRPFAELLHGNRTVSAATAKEKGGDDPFKAVPDKYPVRFALMGAPKLTVSGDIVTASPNPEREETIDDLYVREDAKTQNFAVLLKRAPQWGKKAF